MVFSDTTLKQGIIEGIDFTCGSDSNVYPLADKTRNVNRAMDKVVSLIFGADGIWEWDDSNQTDLPVATTDLVSGQSDYAFAVSHLKITRVMVKDSSGNWHTVKAFDITQDNAANFLIGNNNSGVPYSYDKRANSIFLSPVPNYASTGGLRIYFQRPSTYFTASDTTKEPGFASVFHRYLVLAASYDYQLAKGLVNVAKNGGVSNPIYNEMKEMESMIHSFYGRRNDRDSRASFRPKARNYE